ncbi:adenosylcobinamide-phosphate synthase CbiB [Parasphingorhabdus cellanae]|uniref:Cobalamin biosynthesis protein CobD n=1 Tax=Parasphingorhabdus cellanae TaxID=2806553 RepID=A0ABX7T596_9SPHN|nr:adenosylcobinamide-phosphate synthase CbiB [Parasphingorhabdus cellanae]QTD56764.1 cobalamin biosynthesis protein CobD [Parasphingorhabdus cellanae]
MNSALLLVALVVEAVIGYPDTLNRRIPHPVVWTGRLISGLDRRWNNGHARQQRRAGIVVVVILVLLPATIGLILEVFLIGWFGMVLLVLIATTGLAQRSLYIHVRGVMIPLKQGDMAQARKALSMIVGRDTDHLDEQAIASAATESLAESFCDGIVAPAFWFLIAGLPGLFVFKAISTADSQIGHLDARYRHFGWAAARADDVMNFLPARIAGFLICIAAPGGWRIMFRDARKHLSPNAGWSEAAMAGALHVQMGGGAFYDGEWIERQALGDGPRPQVQQLSGALAIYIRACLLLWIITGAIIGTLIWLL